jgi:multidrug efflux system membrane fusion protein
MRNGDSKPAEKRRFPGIVIRFGALLVLAVAGMNGLAQAEDFQVKPQTVTDTKTVYGTVQAAVDVPARARISGSLQDLSVDDGSYVKKGEQIAQIVDEKLNLQRLALDAKIAASKSNVDNYQLEYDRAQKLYERGTIAKSRIDQLETQLIVAQNTLKAAEAEKAVLEQQMTEGKVLAPSSGRVLDVPVTAGSFVMGGEVIATVAQEGFLLRIEVPERHARSMKVGDEVMLGAEPMKTDGSSAVGHIVKVYPKISQGRVVADAEVPGLGDFFVGERIQVRIAVGNRQAIIIPEEYISTRFGLDFVKLATEDGETLEIVVELGDRQTIRGKSYVEVLSGLKDGDRLVQP